MTTLLDDLLFRIIVRKEASAEANVNRFIVQIKKIQRELNKTATSQRRLTAAQRVARSVMGALTGTIGRVVAALGGFLILRRLIRLTTEFETKIAEMATVIAGSEAKVAGMRREIIALSRAVPQSASELTAGAYAIFSAQILDAAEALTVLTASSKAAVGGLTDTKTAAEAIAGVINAYGLAAEDATRISDVLFQTVELGQIKFKQLSVEIGTALTSAALAGVTFEELSAAIATMTLRQIAAAETTTSLNRLFIALTRQTPAQIEALKRVGLEFNVAAVREKGFIEVIKELNRLTKGQLDALSELFPNIRAARSVFVLAGKGIDQYTVALEKMNTGSGAAERAFNKLAGTTDNVAKLLRNNFNAAILELSESILPAAVTAMEIFIDVLDRLRFSSLQSPQFVATIETLAKVAGRLTGVSLPAFTPEQRRNVVKELAEDMNNLIGLTDAFGSAITRQSLNLLGLAESIKKLTDEELLALTRGAAALALPTLGLDDRVRRQLVEQLEVINQEIKRRPELVEFLQTGKTQKRIVEEDEEQELINVQQLARRRELEEELARRISALTLSTAQRQIEAIEALRAKYEEEYKGNIPEAAEEGFRRITAAAEKSLRVEDAKKLAAKYTDTLEAGLRDIEIDLFPIAEEERIVLSIKQRTVLLEQEKASIEANLQAIGITVEEEKELEKVLVRILRLLEDITDEQKKTADEAARATKERFRELQLQLNLIAQAVDGVLELAEAFGLVDESTAAILNNLTSIGIGAANIATGIAAKNPLAIAAGVSSLAGGLAGLGAALFGGENEEDRRRRETLEANTRALELLTETMSIQAKVFGQFTARQLEEGQRLAQRLGLPFPSQLKIGLEDLTGPQLDLIERLAATLSITLDGTAASFKALEDAIKGLDIRRLVEDFQFALRATQQRFAIRDIEDPIDQIEELLKLLDKFSGVRPTGGRVIDFGKGADRDFLEAALERLFEQALAGLISTGGLSLPEFLDLISQIESLLDDVEDRAGDTRQFAFDRTITEVTGSRIAALLFGIQFETMRIADNSDIMVALLEVMAGSTPMTAPTVMAVGAQSATAASGPTISIGNIDIDVHLSGSVDEGNAIEIGQTIGDSIIERIDKGLGDRIRESARLSGEIILQ